MNNLIILNIRWIVRDRILQVLGAVSFFLMLLVPPMSALSMRQSQEMAITLALSFVSFSLLVFALSLGSSIIWRDIERRYSYAVLSLPLNRSRYLLAKFFSVTLFLLFAGLLTGICSFIAIFASSVEYPSQIPVQWGMIALAIFMDTLKAVLLAAVAILVTTVSTSFFMPFFTSIAIFFAGSASQDVFEFVTSASGAKVNATVRFLSQAIYYLLPNFSPFNFKLQAVYPIPFDFVQISYVTLYFVVYTAGILSAALMIFARRELA